MPQHTTGPHSVDNLPRFSIELLCKALHAKLLGFRQEPIVVPGDIRDGDEISVTLSCHVLDANATPQRTYEHTFTLPLIFFFRSGSGEVGFRVADRVIDLEFIGEKMHVAWSALDENGAFVFVHEAGYEDYWTCYSDLEGGWSSVRVGFAEDGQPVYPQPWSIAA